MAGDLVAQPLEEIMDWLMFGLRFFYNSICYSAGHYRCYSAGIKQSFRGISCILQPLQIVSLKCPLLLGFILFIYIIPLSRYPSLIYCILFIYVKLAFIYV